MALEKTFGSAFGNAAMSFAVLGTVSFVMFLASLGLSGWGLVQVLLEGAVSRETRLIQQTVMPPLAICAVIAFSSSAFVFLSRVYRVRKFLTDKGVGKFSGWLETLIAFGIPVANFFVPWNRLDVIRETLRNYRETGSNKIALDAKKKLRGVGIAWGITSLISVRGQIEEGAWMSVALAVDFGLFALSLWTFVIATRWLSELETDIQAVVERGSDD
ncbi:MAG: hypothetical protein IT547_02510 [Hyphomonadaceae bacterium]|nr:hypothetical protein [Hyphomonadaceae bacterium]